MSRGGLPAEWTMNEPPTKAQAGPSEGKGQPPPRVDLSMADLAVILEHAKTALSDTEFATLQEAMQTLAFLTRELEKKSVSIQRLKQLLFGASTETTAKVIQAVRQAVGTGSASAGPAGAKPKGHGRNGAEAYVGAAACAGGTGAGCTPATPARPAGRAPSTPAASRGGSCG